MSKYTEELDKKLEGTPLENLPRSEVRKTRMYQVSRELNHFYRSHIVSAWQREKVNEIRALYEHKQKELDKNYNIATTKLAVEFMEFEIEYLKTSDRLKEENGGKEPFHKDARRFLSPLFWRGIGEKIYGKKAS